jgi:hypothetical protein
MPTHRRDRFPKEVRKFQHAPVGSQGMSPERVAFSALFSTMAAFYPDIVFGTGGLKLEAPLRNLMGKFPDFP